MTRRQKGTRLVWGASLVVVAIAVKGLLTKGDWNRVDTIVMACALVIALAVTTYGLALRTPEK